VPRQSLQQMIGRRASTYHQASRGQTSGTGELGETEGRGSRASPLHHRRRMGNTHARRPNTPQTLAAVARWKAVTCCGQPGSRKTQGPAQAAQRASQARALGHSVANAAPFQTIVKHPRALSVCASMEEGPRRADSLSAKQIRDEMERRGLKVFGFQEDNINVLQKAFDEEWEVLKKEYERRCCSAVGFGLLQSGGPARRPPPPPLPPPSPVCLYLCLCFPRELCSHEVVAPLRIVSWWCCDAFACSMLALSTALLSRPPRLQARGNASN
jgi:hypothetical protein